jgi:Flp pilus assembly pilin Flp
MKKLINKAKALWCDESAQGATEYILLLAIIVGIAIMFKKPLTEMISNKMSEISGAVANFKPE